MFFSPFGVEFLVVLFFEKWCASWWFQIFFIFTPIWGRWTHFDEHIFQLGWNHQLVCFIFYFLVGVTLDFLNFVSVTLTRTRVVQKTSSHHYSGIHKPKVSAWFFQNVICQYTNIYIRSQILAVLDMKTLEFFRTRCGENHMSNEKRAPGGLGYIGDELLPSCIGILTNHDVRILIKKTTRKTHGFRIRPVFFCRWLNLI